MTEDDGKEVALVAVTKFRENRVENLLAVSLSLRLNSIKKKARYEVTGEVINIWHQ